MLAWNKEHGKIPHYYLQEREQRYIAIKVRGSSAGVNIYIYISASCLHLEQ